MTDRRRYEENELHQSHNERKCTINFHIHFIVEKEMYLGVTEINTTKRKTNRFSFSHKNVVFVISTLSSRFYARILLIFI